MSFADLLTNDQIQALASTWLFEDAPNFDYGGYVVGDIIGKCILLCKSKGILCGKPFVDVILSKVNCTIKWYIDEGCTLEPITDVAEISGKVKDLLIAERVVLNVLARASGIAFLCRRMQEIKISCGWSGEVAGTRKTTPGFRYVEKYSMLVGGCSTHRYDLSSMVMLKDNHIWTVGNITKAVRKARNACSFSMKIEVECRNVTEALEACSAGADIVMLDNFDSSVIEAAAAEIKKSFPCVIVEASGGINERNVRDFMTPSVDVVSSSCLTQGFQTVDFSMKIIVDGRDPTNPTVKEMT